MSQRLSSSQRQFSLRASVTSACNMFCLYCPRYTSMEDYTPTEYRGRGLPDEQYLTILRRLLQVVSFSSVSLTGGEPLANRRLSEIAAAARPFTNRLELNTNGLLLTSVRWAELRPYFDLVKISLDTLDSKKFKEITLADGEDPLGTVLEAIRLVRDSGVNLAVNCVITRSTIEGLDDLIRWAFQEGVRLHLLDFYYTDERREYWQKEFVPIETLMPDLKKKFGEPQLEPIFGCRFYTFKGEGSGLVRVKTSLSGTMRSARCQKCKHYCQEGLYGLKLSRDGWLTSCPSNALEDGTLLEPAMSDVETREKIAWLIDDLGEATYTGDSFTRLLHERNMADCQSFHH